jgi:endoglucanase
MRRPLTLLLALLVLAGLPPAAGAASVPVPPLHTEGARLVDARGRTVVLQGVNWFGFETSAHVVHGLWARDHRDVLRQVRRLGFTTLRLPFSLEALRSRAPVTAVDTSGGRNAALRGATPLEALDVIVDAAAREGLLVLLENHSAADDGFQHGLWYGPEGFTEDDWVATWRALARRYRDRPNVIGADLKNEPHGPATWGTGGPTDWRRAAERAGEAVTRIAPRWLVVVQGVEGPVPGQRLATHWWGGNLEGVRRAPVRLSRSGRLVYSPHEYGPGVFPQAWFARPDVARVLEHRWRTGFGFIREAGIAPLLVGEFGGREVGLDTVEGRWQRQFADYLGRTGISWTYWALNPNSGDTGGVLRDDWTTVDAAKMVLLRRMLRRARIAFRAWGGEAGRGGAPPPSGSLRARLVVDDRWDAGWCGRLVVSGRGPLASARLTFTLAPGTSVTQSWNATLSAASGRIEATLPAWATAPHEATGLCVSGTGEPGPVDLG